MIKIILLVFLFIILFCNNIEGFEIDNKIYRLSTNKNNRMHNDYMEVEKDITQDTNINSREHFFESLITNIASNSETDYFNSNKVVNCGDVPGIPGRCNRINIDHKKFLKDNNNELLVDPFYKYADYRTNNKLIHEDNVISKILSFNTGNELTISNRAREYQQIF